MRRIFFARDADAILSMPRPRTSQQDVWDWAFDKTGTYTVRSAYKLVLEEGIDNAQHAKSSNGGETKWRALWKLKVMPKIRIFWWRVLKGILPRHAELHRRHMKELSQCPICGHEEESLYHAFISCDHAKKFWVEAQNFFQFKLPNLHPVTWREDILDSQILSKKVSAIVVSVMWSIWSIRNKFTHGEDQFQHLKSMELVNELIRALEFPPEGKKPNRNVPGWKPPDVG